LIYRKGEVTELGKDEARTNKRGRGGGRWDASGFKVYMLFRVYMDELETAGVGPLRFLKKAITGSHSRK